MAAPKREVDLATERRAPRRGRATRRARRRRGSARRRARRAPCAWPRTRAGRTRARPGWRASRRAGRAVGDAGLVGDGAATRRISSPERTAHRAARRCRSARPALGGHRVPGGVGHHHRRPQATTSATRTGRCEGLQILESWRADRGEGQADVAVLGNLGEVDLAEDEGGVQLDPSGARRPPRATRSEQVPERRCTASGGDRTGVGGRQSFDEHRPPGGRLDPDRQQAPAFSWQNCSNSPARSPRAERCRGRRVLAAGAGVAAAPVLAASASVPVLPVVPESAVGVGVASPSAAGVGVGVAASCRARRGWPRSSDAGTVSSTGASGISWPSEFVGAGAGAWRGGERVTARGERRRGVGRTKEGVCQRGEARRCGGRRWGSRRCPSGRSGLR